MKTKIMLAMILCCSAWAIGTSHRITALGTDLAHLVPDYETDLYRNPQLLGRALIGISYAPDPVYYYVTYPFPPFYVQQTPISPTLTANNFGVMGEYWMNYEHGLNPTQYGWQISNFAAYRIQDLWMSRVKKLIINIYNDLDYSKIKYLTSTNSWYVNRHLEYLIKTQSAFRITKNLTLDIKIGFGFYERKREESNYLHYNQRINLGLARAGLYCRNVIAANDFTSWYFDIGSPMSNTEIDSVPYSVYSCVLDDEHIFMLSARTLLSRLGIAKAIPLTRTGMFIIGARNSFLLQCTEDVNADQGLRGIENIISLPVAIEYSLNTITLRFGTRFWYDFLHLRQASDDYVITQRINHAVDYGYSFGLGWNPHKNLTLDLYNNGDLWRLQNWAVYLKYEF
jgi:hypothetical protein